jgi:hypothetical protein
MTTQSRLDSCASRRSVMPVGDLPRQRGTKMKMITGTGSFT